MATDISPRQRLLVRAITLIGILAAAIGLYIYLGSPQIPDHPLAERRAQSDTMTQTQVEALVANRPRQAPAPKADPEFEKLIGQLKETIAQRGPDMRHTPASSPRANDWLLLQKRPARA